MGKEGNHVSSLMCVGLATEYRRKWEASDLTTR